MCPVACPYLLGNVPDVPRGVQPHQSVVDGHLVKRRFLLVAEERVRDPDMVEAGFTEADLPDATMDGRKGETRIAPRLPQVHAD